LIREIIFFLFFQNITNNLTIFILTIKKRRANELSLLADDATNLYDALFAIYISFSVLNLKTK